MRSGQIMDNDASLDDLYSGLKLEIRCTTTIASDRKMIYNIFFN